MLLTFQPETAPTAPLSLELDALLHRVACAPLPNIGWIRVTGSDRVRWLNGMVTNSIGGLDTGHGCYNFVLNAQGRIQADLTAFLLEDSILLETGREQIAPLITFLDRFIIMDDVELSDIPSQRLGLLIAGPDALRTVQQLGGDTSCSDPAPAAAPASLSLKQTIYHGASVSLLRAYSPLIPRFELWASPGTITELAAELAALPTASPEALEALRILEGTPRYGTDIRNTDTARDLPQETNQARALHFSKGCYLGQEIVERIRSRGNVHRTFSGFQLTGVLPAPGTILSAEGKPVGELTSVSAIPLDPPIQLALGYLRREILDLPSARAVPLTYPGGTALPVAVPFSNA